MEENLLAPLNDEEISRLDRFLLDRIDEDEDTGDRDEGVIGVSELDGLLTAVVSGPVLIPPSAWLPAVWGDFEPVWDSEDDLMAILSLMIRRMNHVSFMLMEHPDEFAPIFLERRAGDETFLVVDEWCEGYARGMSLAADQWDAGGEEITSLVVPILAFTSVMEWRAHDYGDRELDVLQRAVIKAARDVHAFWLARRLDMATSTVRHSGPRPGRNDPCPCGSGKKYKKCCLH